MDVIGPGNGPATEDRKPPVRQSCSGLPSSVPTPEPPGAQADHRTRTYRVDETAVGRVLQASGPLSSANQRNRRPGIHEVLAKTSSDFALTAVPPMMVPRRHGGFSASLCVAVTRRRTWVKIGETTPSTGETLSVRTLTFAAAVTSPWVSPRPWVRRWRPPRLRPSRCLRNQRRRRRHEW